MEKNSHESISSCSSLAEILDLVSNVRDLAVLNLLGQLLR